MPKTSVCTCTENTSKQQKSRCRTKRQCNFLPQQSGRKPTVKKEDPKVVTARYEKSVKGKWRKVKRKWKKWAGEVKEELAKLPVKPRVSHRELGLGTWTPVPAKSPPMAEPLPTRKRGQLPKAFVEEVLKRRTAFFEKRAREEEHRSLTDFVKCPRCHWLQHCAGGFWKGVSPHCPDLHGVGCEYFDL